MKRLAAGVIVFVVIALMGVVYAIHPLTVIDWWKPALGCGPLAAAVGWLSYRLMPRRVSAGGGVVVGILSFAALLAAFYSLNYFVTDTTSAVSCEAPLVRRYSERRTSHSGRRHSSARDRSYTVYFVEVSLPDGSTKSIELPLDTYNKVGRRGALPLTVEKGLFGISVLRLQTKNVK